jgi:hypothetical protein
VPPAGISRVVLPSCLSGAAPTGATLITRMTSADKSGKAFRNFIPDLLIYLIIIFSRITNMGSAFERFVSIKYLLSTK